MHDPAALLASALQHHRAGQLAQAEALYRQLLQSHPHHPDALHLLGVIAHQLGQHERAVHLIQQAIQFNTASADYHRDLALVYHMLNKLDEAVACYQQAIFLQPDLTETYLNLGNVLDKQGNLVEAVACYQQALAIKPNYADIHYNLGHVLDKQGKLDVAVACYQKALVIKPDLAEAHYNLGHVLDKQGKPDIAVACYQQSIAANPNYAEAYNNIGNILFDLGKLDEAKVSYQQAIAIRPDYFEAYNNLGSTLLNQGKPDKAMPCYQQAVAIKFNFVPTHSSQLFAMQYIVGDTPAEILTAHQRYAERVESPLQASWPIHRNVQDPHKRLKIGYVSPDFRFHSVAFFIEPVLTHHDKSQVEVYGYYNHAQRDAVTDQIQSYTDHWIPCHTWSDDALAERILEDRIDILVDLAGHTRDNRLLTFARKPAPIQVTYLGYPATTGLAAIDYRFTTLDADPLGNDAYHSEALYRLPQALWCYRPPMEAPDVSLPTPAVTQGYVTFASMNNIAKVFPEALALWAQILLAVPHSRLIMTHVPIGSARLSLHERFAAHGISPERLTLHGSLPIAQFRQLPRHIDIALDPYPYQGTTTTCEALWMGLPMISLKGQTCVSRSGFVLLKALKLEELVAQSPQDYVRIAKNLAADLPRLTALRASLRDRFNASPLRNELAFTQHIELAYRSMWHTWCLQSPHP